MPRVDETDDYHLGPVSDHVRAVLRVEPPPEAACAVIDSGPTRGAVTQDVIDGDTRQCRAEVADGTDRFLLEAAVGDGCVCPIFREHDCVSSVDGVDDGALLVSVSTTDREELAAIVASLRDLGSTVRLERATRGDVHDGRYAIQLGVDDLTPKQRETLRVAVEAGYYDRPRGTDLGELAEEFDVSRSAISQRLSAVEEKLVRELAAAIADDHVVDGHGVR